MSKIIGRKTSIKRTTEDYIVDALVYILLILIAFITIYPFYYVILASLNDGYDMMRGKTFLYPTKFTLMNYKNFLSDDNWTKAFGVSVLRTLSGTVLSTILTSMVAYGLSRRHLMFRKVYLFMIVFSMYFSGGLIPYYVVLRNLSLLNKFYVYIIPTMLNLFFVLVGISFFRSIPEALFESAKLDGANELVVLFRIVLPVSLPFIATLALFSGVGQWNSWLDSTYFVRDENLRTMAYRMVEQINRTMIQESSTAQGSVDSGSIPTMLTAQSTAVVISMLPIMCVYPFLQKYFIQGIMLGSVKE
jgi:putative aldouronate transport system permease protein